jgi:hypothetical protein
MRRREDAAQLRHTIIPPQQGCSENGTRKSSCRSSSRHYVD